MADHGSVFILTPDTASLQIHGLNVQTAITGIAYSDAVRVINTPVRADDMVRINSFGIAGTGADTTSNSGGLAKTGQIYPFAVSPGDK